jgi:hypothetical protein
VLRVAFARECEAERRDESTADAVSLPSMDRISDLLKFRDSESGWVVVLEDDGRVAYAYLRNASEQTVADVWLYNRQGTPELPEWGDRALLPFRNPLGYAQEWSPPTSLAEADARVVWAKTEKEEPRAAVHLWGEQFAILEPAARPGWSRLALEPGPLESG